MNVQFSQVAFAEIEMALRLHLASLPCLIDSFLEEHILGSNHYLIQVRGETAGFASIHGGSLITQFTVDESFRKYGQEIFRQLREIEQVQSAFVPTCDEFYLAHALDDYRQLEKQAYFFRPATWSMRSAVGGHWRLQQATSADAGFIRQQTGDFFGPLDQRIEANEIFLTTRQDERVGLGILETSGLYADVASIGMFTIEEHRQQGVGTATITMLIDECRRRGLRAVAGCAYSNHPSKQTLERAGMYAPSRLLKISY